MSINRSPSPSPTITLHVSPHRELARSSSEESLRLVHGDIVFANSPYPRKVTYIKSYESEAELVRRQLAAISLQPLTYAEELAAKRQQLEIKAEKRRRGQRSKKVPAEKENNVNSNGIPEIIVASPSPGGKSILSFSPTKKVAASKGPKVSVKDKISDPFIKNGGLMARQQRLKPKSD